MAWYKFKIFTAVLSASLFVGCSVFGGVTITGGSSRPEEHAQQKSMSLTIPEKGTFTKESKESFSKLINDSIQKLSVGSAASQRVDNLKRLLKLLSQANSESELYELFKSDSKVHTVEEVLFTGYYKPLFKGSLKRSVNYSAPLYSYPTSKPTSPREELVTSGALKSHEIIYLKDPFEAYLAEIQGSVGIVLESGQVVHLAFAGSNNHKYVSIGSELVADGKLTKTDATIPGIKAYFLSHPGSMTQYIYRNPRMVFFRKSAGETLGSSGVELVAERAVATDHTIYPAGSILFVNVEIPKKESKGQWSTQLLSKFMIALDCGSAIKGPKRIDLYLGEGSEVGEVAGRLNSRGKLEVF